MSRTHDDTTRTEAPRSAQMGYGHSSRRECAACGRHQHALSGRRLKRVQGVKRWVCKDCSK